MVPLHFRFHRDSLSKSRLFPPGRHVNPRPPFLFRKHPKALFQRPGGTQPKRKNLPLAMTRFTFGVVFFHPRQYPSGALAFLMGCDDHQRHHHHRWKRANTPTCSSFHARPEWLLVDLVRHDLQKKNVCAAVAHCLGRVRKLHFPPKVCPLRIVRKKKRTPLLRDTLYPRGGRFHSEKNPHPCPPPCSPPTVDETKGIAVYPRTTKKIPLFSSWAW